MKIDNNRFLRIFFVIALCFFASGCREKGSYAPDTAGDDPSRTLESFQDADGYVYEARDETVYATGDVNIRAGSTSQSEIVAVLREGESIVRTAYNYSWSKVLYEDRICYIASQYLTTDPSAD